jgi:hypothetical protein
LAAAALPDRHIALADALADDDDDWSAIESVIDPFGDVTAPDMRIRPKPLSLSTRGYAARRCVNGGPPP